MVPIEQASPISRQEREREERAREGRRENSTEPLRWKDDRPWTIWPSNRVAGRPLSRTRWAPWCVYKCVSISLSHGRLFPNKASIIRKVRKICPVILRQSQAKKVHDICKSREKDRKAKKKQEKDRKGR